MTRSVHRNARWDNRARQVAVLGHAADVQVLDADGVKAPRQARGELVQRIASDIADARVHAQA